ncbi:hypothetical protein RI129_008384 [Pyrocoelia pectoralis]|uniref:Glutathione S-transferase n=1 Tax=Pyrocoelia pectoralis TaxID=417401 RepID=A0AAN7ZHD9_9COLE
MAPILYKASWSPAVRSVYITAKVLNLTFDERDLNLLNGEHLKPEFLKLNPLHTIPTLDDGGNVICDSHAIDTYLVDKYGKDDSLYPKDLYQRALVNQKLAFNLGMLYPVLKEIDLAYIKGEIKKLRPKDVEEIKTIYNFVETFLTNCDWIALPTLSLADIHCYTTISSLNFHLNLNEKDYPKTCQWMKRCRNLPFFDGDDKGLKLFEDWLGSFQS